jgi:alanyl-tRNA synthetase
VARDRLRFDFTHAKPLTSEELAAIEEDVNLQALRNTPVETHLMTPEEASKKGAMALFGEKYGDEVRVLTMGIDGTAPYSVELCGGTHVRRTGDIGLFKILSESGVSSGIRRIEAIAGKQAYLYVQNLGRQMDGITEQLKCSLPETLGKLNQILVERKTFERQIKELRQKLALSAPKGGSTLESSDRTGIKQIGRFNVIIRELVDIPAKDLKPLADQLKREVESGVVILISQSDGKVALVVGVTSDLTDLISAVELVQVGGEALGGKGGGGRPDMAQAGGNDPTLIQKALMALEKVINTRA